HWDLIKNGNRQPFTVTQGYTSSVTVTAQSVVDVFGSFSVTDAISVAVRDIRNDYDDGTQSIIEYPVSAAFNIKSPAPQLSISTESMICDVPGRVQIESSTIYN